uniref:Uncharacterized protein n=1 Tax=Amphimedon queenslandica TaxID=400682 RepID=A0A1X7VWA3_AMPQE
YSHTLPCICDHLDSPPAIKSLTIISNVC